MLRRLRRVRHVVVIAFVLLLAGCALSVLVMDSASDGWAIGTCGASGPYETFLLHYHSGAWSLYQNAITLT